MGVLTKKRSIPQCKWFVIGNSYLSDPEVRRIVELENPVGTEKFLQKTFKHLLVDRGWGNGYVCIPPGHPFYGLSYNDIHNMDCYLDVHGGLTFSNYEKNMNWPGIPEELRGKEYFIIGFHTTNYYDNPDNMPKEKVEELAQRLCEYCNTKCTPNQILYRQVYYRISTFIYSVKGKWIKFKNKYVPFKL